MQRALQSDPRRAFGFAPFLGGVVALLLSGLGAAPALAQEAETGTLTIAITGLASNNGVVNVAIFDSADSWMGIASQSKSLEIVDGSCTWVVEDLPLGDYGVAVTHDANGNGQFDTDSQGIPLETYGFSNNARGQYGPAEWSAAKFEVTAPKTEIKIEVW